jgi:Flagellin and related hook-associated proteins
MKLNSILNRMRDLAVQAANDTNTDDDRAAIQQEVDELVAEIDRIADTTQFNTQALLDGNFSNKIIHIGAK